ncbi:hypothetical protein KSS87_014520 [Heliosperma pusillum]|nr:hypothetical protein KSS87_014520 [Heliosperma pusillum]
MKAEKRQKGPWYEEEDERLKALVSILGDRRWDSLARASGLRRSGKSCRLRWLNYLRPCLKHGPITPTEVRLIHQLQEKWGNKWADIARRLPGRTDNEIKNYWRSHLRKKMYLENDTISLSEETSSCLSDQTNNSNYNQCESTLECKTKIEQKSEMNKEASVKNIVEIETGIQDSTITSSLYNDQLSCWMSKLSKEQSDISGYERSWETYNGFGYFDDWSLRNENLWEVDLFNVNPLDAKTGDFR